MQVSLEQFMAQLTECGLLSQAELSSAIESLPPDQRPKDPTALAKELIRLEKLTPYQAKAVYQGKGANLVLGNYVVMDKLGQGGMGMVLKARHRRMDRVVALKVLFSRVVKTPGAIERFHREVKAAARLTHPNIVTAYDADEVNQTHFLVMEFVEGADLAQLVAQKGPLPPAQAADCIVQAAKGLAYAHSQGVIHRDIKPANLLLDRHGVIRILDMGMARLDATGDADLTGTGQIMGTVNYMAPEQSVNTKNTDARSDVYSLGMTLWFLLTGKPAYEGETLIETLIAHRERPIPSLRAIRPDVSPGLESIFARMVAKSPDARFGSMNELIAALEACSSPSGPPPIDAGSSVLEGWQADSLSGSGLSMPSLSGVAQPQLQPPPPVRAAQFDNTLTTMGDSTDNSGVLVAELTPQPQIQTEHIPVSAAYRKSRGSWLPLIGGIVVLAAIAAAAVVFLLPTSEGTLVIEVNQPGAVVKVLDDQGTVEVTDASGQQKVQLSVKPGSKQVTVTKDGFTIHSQNLTITKGSEELLKVSLQPQQLADNNPTPTTPTTPGGTPATTPGSTTSTPGGTPISPGATNPPLTPTTPTSVRSVAADGSLIFTIDLNNLPMELTRPVSTSNTTTPNPTSSSETPITSTVPGSTPSVTTIRTSSTSPPSAPTGIGSQSGETWFVSAGATGQANYSLEFLTRGYVSVPNFQGPASGPLTIEAYVLPSRHTANRGALVSGPGLYLGGLDLPEWRCSHVFENNDWQSSATRTMTLRGWQHVAGVWTDDELLLFVNGKRVARAPRKSKTLAFAPLLIGAATLPQLGDHFQGCIDEVRISNVARYSDDFTPQPRFEPDPQTLALYHCDDAAGNVLTDSSGKSHHGQIFASEWSPVQEAGLPAIPIGQRGPVTPASLARPWVRSGTPTRYWSNHIIASSSDTWGMYSWLESKVVTYNISGGEKLWDYTTAGNAFSAPTISADGNLLAWSGIGALNLVDMRTNRHATAALPMDYIGIMGFSPDGEYLLARAQKTLSVFQLPNLELKQSFNLETSTNGRELLFHPDGNQVLVTLSNQMTDRMSLSRLINLKTGSEQNLAWPCRPIGFTKDGNGIVVLTSAGVGLLDAKNSQIRLLNDNLRKRLPPQYTATYDPTSQLFAGYNSVPTPKVTLWNLDTGKLLAEVPVSTAPKMAVLGGGKALAILERDRLQIWVPPTDR